MRSNFFERAIASLALIGQAAVAAQSPAEVPRRLPDSDVRVHVAFPNGRLIDALDCIGDAGKLTVRAEADVKPLLEQRIVIEFSDLSVEEALAAVLKAAKLTYKVIDDQTVEILRPEP